MVMAQEAWTIALNAQLVKSQMGFITYLKLNKGFLHGFFSKPVEFEPEVEGLHELQNGG